MYETQCIPFFAEDSKLLRAEVAEREITNVSTKGPFLNGKPKKWPLLTKKRVNVHEAELKRVRNV